MEDRLFKVMVANRGEIAIRVFRACYDLNLRTVAIYSKEDIYSLFRTKADEAYLVGEHRSPLGAYLDIDRIIKLAIDKKVDAIHPGYGFLSENAQFAKACEQAGIIFIGPPSDVLAQMGDKIAAKAIAVKAEVPTIPGSENPIEDLDEAAFMAAEFGYPIILKAAAGGGGRGMRLIHNEAELRENFSLVQGEAQKAFGNGSIFMEKYLESPKHIEVQIMGDKYGNIVHLFERDCSVQRRYQKVIEYTPAFTVPLALRERIYEDALKIARAVNYVNAGTVEFLVDKDNNHYFIEMNPRIQVEHTVTEVTTGVDLVQAQILIAQGLALTDPQLNLTPETIQQKGFAIQCRVTTEDPRNNFAPDTGKMTVYRSGGGNGVRLDAGNAFTGAEISPYYDSLLVKITTFDRTFAGTVRKALRSLNEIRVRGVKTNMAFLVNVLQHPVFLSGQCNTKFIDETPELFDIEPPQDRATKVLRYIGDIIVNEPQGHKRMPVPLRVPSLTGQTPPDSWKRVLDEQGPQKLSQMILQQDRLLITDTTMRDAHQSLLATRVRTRDMLVCARQTAELMASAFSLEMWGGATFDVAYRFLHESPWTRLEELRVRIPNILFQMLFRGANAVGYTSYPDNVVKAFIRESARKGIDVFRIFDSLNWLPNMELAIEEVCAEGKVAQAAICYTGDILNEKETKYPLRYYVDMAKELEKRGAHILCIKDMAGLLKPFAARLLVKALKEEISIPVDLHTHDTSGNQVAALLMATEAGLDIADCALASMSSFTSQPSLNAIAAALQGSARDTGFDMEDIQKLSEYWEDVRPLYAPYEAGLDHPDTEIYKLEIPGGQYSNFKEQVQSLGLYHRFAEVKETYAAVNRLLGNIVKVTPSSKMVGDLALFMVQNDLTEENIVEKGVNLNFPDSVISYFKGMMGQPYGGFPKDLQRVVLKGEKAIDGRPGEMLPPEEFEAIRAALPEGYRDQGSVLAYCLYPKVLEEYREFMAENGDLSRMETSVFLQGMLPGEATEMTIEDGKTLALKFIGLGESNADGTRNVNFELNGSQRTVSVKENLAENTVAVVPMADVSDPGQVSAAIPGIVSQILVETGERVEAGRVLAVIEAMKMETNLQSLKAGVIGEMRVVTGQTIQAGELLMRID